jgi:damage-control phosphatase, subfamily III
MPVIITKAIDLLFRSKTILVERYTEAAIDDSKDAIERLSKLRYELQTDKQLTKINDSGEDAYLWNEALEQLESTVGLDNLTWFKAPWLMSECYMYRRIREAMLNCSTELKNYDPYEEAKIETYKQAETTIINLIKNVCPIDFEDEEKNNLVLREMRLKLLLEVSLWSNKNDLSLSGGNDCTDKVKNLLDLIEGFKKNIIKDETDILANFIIQGAKKARLDFILDNTGMEFMSDLLLCDYLLRNDYFEQIYLHGKAYSWFVSDLTKFDFDYIIKQLRRVNSINVNLFLNRIDDYLASNRLVWCSEGFWTTAYSFKHMSNIDLTLFESLTKSDLALFKGDLNYRKLFGDLAWSFDTEPKLALNGFQPTNLGVLRTLKSDIVVGLETSSEKVKRIREEHKDWMTSGDFGLIQFIAN